MEITIFPELYRKSKMEAVRKWSFFLKKLSTYSEVIHFIIDFQDGMAGYIFGRNDSKCRYWSIYWYCVFTAFNHFQISKVNLYI